MSAIRNPEAYAIWLKRKQMAEQQAQNVQTYNQSGVTAAVQQPQLLEILLQQAALRQAKAQAIRKAESPLGAYNDVFGGYGSAIPGYGGRKSAYQDLNLGRED